MFFLFRKTLDPLFQGNRPISLKAAGCAAVGAFCGLILILGLAEEPAMRARLSPLIIAGILAGAAVLGAIVGAALMVKDYIGRRPVQNEPAAFLLDLLFGMGVWSLMVWFMSLTIITFLLTIATLGVDVL